MFVTPMTLSKITSMPRINFSKIRLDIRSCQSKLVRWRRQFHIKPELGFQEQATGAFIAQTLTKIGIPHRTGIAKTGIVATISSPYPGPVLAIRSDMDALPIQEENQVPYCSQNNGIMHACGHDGHMAIALGTAEYLWHHRHDFKGTVKIIFQPAEESPGGAKLMIDEGALKNPDVDAIIGLHLWNNFPLGTVGISGGPLMAAVECFRLDIFGKGGHGAMPERTVDPVVVSAQIVNALQTVVSRSVNPLDSAVVTVGELHAGTGLNVIADKASMSGTVRYFNPNLKGYFGQRIEEIVAGICKTFGATYELNYWWLYPPVINDEKMVDLVRSVATDIIETPAGIISSCQTMAGEDMSFFLQEIPGCYFFLGSANQDKGFTYPHHHPRFDFDETALLMGVEIFVRAAEKFCQ